jgi:hypothetical protein
MPNLSLTVSHQLDQQQAIERLKGFLDKVKQRYQDQVSNLEENWNDNQLQFGFTTYGFNVKGNLDVQADAVVIDGQIPLAAMMFKGKIEQTIRDELTRLLA